MFRHLGSILVAVMALVLTACVAVILAMGLAERLRAPPEIHLTVFDGVAALGRHPPRIRAEIRGARPGRPFASPWMVARFEDGWSAWLWVNNNGQTSRAGRPGLGRGSHRYTVGLSELEDRMDVVGEGTVWVWPREDAVVWLDAGAIVSLLPLADEKTADAAMRDAVDAVKTLASGRHPVYLVAADGQGYASARRRLQKCGAPPGPAFWVTPGKEPSRLLGLKGVWPTIDGAVVCGPAVRKAVEKLGVPVYPVPPATVAAGTTEARDAWRSALERVTARRAGSGVKGN
ncbi:MAG TPA: hypothetical protein VM431_00210 [Phycisphaerae bacterium]|nr:hypothetical protein [Phycisphaerae bacterium]